MIIFPNAKINLGLNIITKRPDGFHDLRTIFYPVPLCDILEIIPSPGGTFQFTASGIPVPGKAEDNLCLLAYYLLKKKYKIPAVHIHLHKVIPLGAGLGGGSSDAAFTLLQLNHFFNLKLKQQEIEMYASQLGSDCTFFTRNIPVLAQGRGDLLENIPFSIPGSNIVIVKPTFSVNTAFAYSLVQPGNRSDDLLKILKKPVTFWKDRLINDFEAPIFNQHPELKDIKEKLYSLGALYSAMSGSGSAIYGIFDKLPGKLEESFPGCFVWAGKTDY
jgi:4-diphosphocytidyl-2-C-methyl-D-erythritol kinase